MIHWLLIRSRSKGFFQLLLRGKTCPQRILWLSTDVTNLSSFENYQHYCIASIAIYKIIIIIFVMVVVVALVYCSDVY